MAFKRLLRPVVVLDMIQSSYPEEHRGFGLGASEGEGIPIDEEILIKA